MKFNPESWRSAANELEGAREAFQDSCDRIIDRGFVFMGFSPVDQAVAEGVKETLAKWRHLIGGASIKLGSDISKMNATANNYSATENNAAALGSRYWTR